MRHVLNSKLPLLQPQVRLVQHGAFAGESCYIVAGAGSRLHVLYVGVPEEKVCLFLQGPSSTCQDVKTSLATVILTQWADEVRPLLAFWRQPC